MKRKSELLKAAEQAELWERLRQWCLDKQLAYRLARKRAAAKKLERLGML